MFASLFLCWIRHRVGVGWVLLGILISLKKLPNVEEKMCVLWLDCDEKLVGFFCFSMQILNVARKKKKICVLWLDCDEKLVGFFCFSAQMLNVMRKKKTGLGMRKKLTVRR